MKTQMFCIVLADRPHGCWKRTYLKTGLRVEKSENAALLFVWTANLHTFRNNDAIAPPLDLSPPNSEPRDINDNDNNNNGGLHARVPAAEDIQPFLQLTRLVVECESQQQFDPHSRFWFPCTSHFHLLLVVFGFSVYCLFTARKLTAHALCLHLRFWWI